MLIMIVVIIIVINSKKTNNKLIIRLIKINKGIVMLIIRKTGKLNSVNNLTKQKRMEILIRENKEFKK